jgi:hypothetical protein
MTRRPLTFQGSDVALRARGADGRPLVDYLDRAGRPLGHSTRCHAHELRGVGWHLAAIKKAIADLPIEGAPASGQPAPRPLLFCHYAARQED